MTHRTLNPAPSGRAVALAQLRMIAHLQKRDFVVLGALLVVLIGLVIWGQTQMDADYDGSDTIAIFRGLAGAMALLGAFWPLGVWRADSPGQRGYFWALPVDRRRHTIVRVGVGWLLLMIVCLLIMAIAAAAMAPSAIRFEQVRLDLAGPWQPLATATLAYLIVSAPTVLFESPVRSLALAWLGVLGLFIVAEAGDLDRLQESVETTVESLFIALGGPIMAPRGSVAIWSRQYALWFALAAVGLLSATLWRHEER